MGPVRTWPDLVRPAVQQRELTAQDAQLESILDDPEERVCVTAAQAIKQISVEAEEVGLPFMVRALVVRAVLIGVGWGYVCL